MEEYPDEVNCAGARRTPRQIGEMTFIQLRMKPTMVEQGIDVTPASCSCIANWLSRELVLP
jgi:hypothetical protein